MLAIVIGRHAWPAPSTSATTKGHEDHPVLFSKWNSFSRIGVYERRTARGRSATLHGAAARHALMDIDSAAATQILKFGGNLKDVATCGTS